MSEFQTTEEPRSEKVTTKEELIEFLGLEKTLPLAELQRQLDFTTRLIPWWLDERSLDFGNQGIVKGPFDPVAVISADLKQNPTHRIAEQPLIYSTKVDKGKGNKITVPPNAELVGAAVEYLQKIGFYPPKPIRGENWFITEPKISIYPTIHDNMNVQVIRDETGKTEYVTLIGYNQE